MHVKYDLFATHIHKYLFYLDGIACLNVKPGEVNN